MTAALIGLLAAGLVLAGLLLAPRLLRGETATYGRRIYLLTPSESDFYRILRTVLADDWHAFAQVRVADLVAITGRSIRTRRLALNKISSKSVDYVICDPQFRPRLVIELNDRTHDLEHRQERDRFVAKICQRAELPLVFAVNRRPFDPDAIRALLAEHRVHTRTLRPAIQLRYAAPGLPRPKPWERRP